MPPFNQMVALSILPANPFFALWGDQELFHSWFLAVCLKSSKHCLILFHWILVKRRSLPLTTMTSQCFLFSPTFPSLILSSTCHLNCAFNSGTLSKPIEFSCSYTLLFHPTVSFISFSNLNFCLFCTQFCWQEQVIGSLVIVTISKRIALCPLAFASTSMHSFESGTATDSSSISFLFHSSAWTKFPLKPWAWGMMQWGCRAWALLLLLPIGPSW